MPAYPDHQDIRPFYFTDTDPGAVGAGVSWVDTSVGPPYQLYIRNITNTGWDEVGSISGGGTGAPTNADYVVGTANAGLSAERVLGSDIFTYDIAANIPASNFLAGRLFYATDTKVLYRDNGASWDRLDYNSINVTFTSGGALVATNVQDAIDELEVDLDAHISDTVDSHDASAISYDPTGAAIVTGTDVQAAITELDTELDAHETDTTDAHDASAVSVSPTGDISSTDVQAALAELDTEKAKAVLATLHYITTQAEADLSGEVVLGTGVIMYGVAGSRPAAGTAGRLYYSTDTDKLERDNGTTWDAYTFDWGQITGVPSTFTVADHDHDAATTGHGGKLSGAHVDTSFVVEDLGTAYGSTPAGTRESAVFGHSGGTTLAQLYSRDASGRKHNFETQVWMPGYNDTGASIGALKVVTPGASALSFSSDTYGSIALADVSTTVDKLIGITRESIANGSWGHVVTQGIIENVDTSGLVGGALLYLTTSGGLTTTQPSTRQQVVGICLISDSAAGRIFVSIGNAGFVNSHTHNGANDGGGSVSPTVLALTGVITPAPSTDQNDYNPTGLSTADYIRIAPTASVTITGLQGGSSGRVIVVTNNSSFNVTLAHESASSSAANRFYIGSADTGLVISPKETVSLIYDSGLSRWVPLNIGRKSAEDFAPDTVILNGDFQFWQRATSFVISGASQDVNTADGWRFIENSGATMAVQTDTNIPTVAQNLEKAPQVMLAIPTVGDASIAAGEYAAIVQNVEGYDFLHIAQREFTIGFWVKAHVTGTYCIYFKNKGSDRTYVAEYQISNADIWEYKMVTVPASPSAGTWDYTNGIGLRIGWALACGSTFQTTAGAWQTGNYLGTSNQVNGISATTSAFSLWGIRIGLGSYVAPYKRPPIQQAWSRIERRREIVYHVIQGFVSVAGEPWGAGANFRVRKGGTPTLTTFGTPSLTNCTVAAVDSQSEEAFRLLVAGTVVGNFLAIYNASGYILAEWEPS